MKKSGKEPRLLQSVMDAIANLKEKQGSSQKQIIEHIATILKKQKDGARNVTMQVRRALDHGLHSGLIKHRSGKYVLGLDKRDFAIFRRFRQVGAAPAPTTCKRRRRARRGRRRRSRRRRGRRRNISNEEREGSEESESGESTAGGGTPEPQDKSRRRKRRGGGRRRRRSRRRRGRRRRSSQDNKQSDSESGKSSKSDLPPEKRRSDSDKVDYQQKNSNSHHQEREPDQHAEEDIMDCGNPQCLCNIKQEDDSPRSMSRENYYNDSYLN